nr:transcription factor SOX-8-like isoform X1 [Penaeus vannamei]
MDSVKKERVSPLLGDAGGFGPDASGRAPPCPLPQGNDHKTTVKSFLANIPQSNSALPTNALTSVITTSASSLSAGADVSPQRTTTGGSRNGGGGGGGGAGAGGVTLSAADTEIVEGLMERDGNFSGEISDAVSKILDDYDWSKIPLANKDGVGDSERRKVHVKRPMNAFMVWAQEARRRLSCSHRQVHNAELSKSLGRIWRGMTEDQKRPFIERADHLRRKHKQEYPDYKYQPRRRKENVKTVNKSPQGHPLGVQDPLTLSGNNHFVGTGKVGGLGLNLHPLSPPHSPSGQGAVRSHADAHIGETVFVSDCLADSFETIDRAEMNKYLLPDQTAGAHYATSAPGAHVPSAGSLQPMTTMSAMPSMNTMSATAAAAAASSSSCSGTLSSGGTGTLTSLPPLASRLIPPAPVYGGSGSPYYTGGASPQPGSHGSPDLGPSDLNGAPTAGGVSPGGSPGSPHQEYVELQPPRVPKEEPLPPLSSPKPSNPFLHQNLCYSTQPYAFQYSYPYATMWH